MTHCLFCRIVKGEIPSTKVYESDRVFAFRDIAPAAPSHVLIIPKNHVEQIHDIPPSDTETMAALFDAARIVVEQEGLVEKGYRIVINSGKHGGQAVDHLHLHILGKRDFSWPPG